MLQLIIIGLASGSLYALGALGIVLVHRSSGVVNFAQTAFGLVGAYVYYELHVNGTSGPLSGFWPAFLLALVTPAVLGFATHYLLMRPLRHAASVTRMIATVALLVIITSASNLRIGVSNVLLVPNVLPTHAISIFGARVGEGLLILLGMSFLITAMLWAVYRWTAFGRATSAVSENRQALASLGRSPDLIAALNWAVAGALAGFVGVFLTMLLGLSSNSLTVLLAPCLTAAFMGRMVSFPATFAGGLVVGVGEALVSRYVHLTGADSAVPFLLVLVFLLIRRPRVESRSSKSERRPYATSGRIRVEVAIPAVLGAMALAWFVFTPEWIDTMTLTVGTACILLSITLVTGFTGQLSLAQLAIAGSGAWAASRAEAGFHMPFLIALLIGVVVAVPIGVIIGFPALRARGVNVGIATLTGAVAVEALIFDNSSLTGGALGTYLRTPSLFGLNLDDVQYPARYFTFALTIFVIAVLVVANTRRGGTGRMLLSVRSNERAAASLGIDVVQAKLFAFALGAAIAATGGVLLTFRGSFVDLSPYGTNNALNPLAMSVIGGIGLLTGGLSGSQLQPGTTSSHFISQYFSGITNWLPLIGGVLLLVALLVAPDGLVKQQADAARLVWKRITRHRRSPERRDAPPAEVADHTGYRVEPKALTASDIVVHFGGVVAVDGVSLDVQPGEVVGLIGPNGAGKTTLIEAITGFVSPASGAVSLGVESLDRRAPHQRSRLGLARSFQTLELFEDMTVLENLLAASDARSLQACLRDLVWPKRRALPQAAQAAVCEFRLGDKLGEVVGNLSYGDRRLVAIARAVGSGASALLLDEPAAGLSLPERRELMRVIQIIAKNWGVALLLVEHDVDLVMASCDRVVALDMGRNIAMGTPAEIRSNQDVIRSYLGSADGEAPGGDPRDRVTSVPAEREGRQLAWSLTSPDQPVY